VTLSLPGFGVPRPQGFGATKEEYVDWLIGALEGIDGPIDLVGHDWGGGFTVRVVSLRPDLVRSWVTDAAGLGDAAFEWHEFAKIWQTPQAGEDFFAQNLAQPGPERGAVFQMFGVPEDRAREMGEWLDETMADSILALYRSAVDVGKEWAPQFTAIPKPGLALLASEDPFLTADGTRRGAMQAGAHLVELDGLGHWWMLQDPARGASVLEPFWASLD
jgi:pimeloyl-ACP methyl ester carboxylesterase